VIGAHRLAATLLASEHASRQIRPAAAITGSLGIIIIISMACVTQKGKIADLSELT